LTGRMAPKAPAGCRSQIDRDVPTLALPVIRASAMLEPSADVPMDVFHTAVAVVGPGLRLLHARRDAQSLLGVVEPKVLVRYAGFQEVALGSLGLLRILP
jgi:hypothetical protein